MKYNQVDLERHEELKKKMLVMKEFGEFTNKHIWGIESIELEVYEKQLPKPDEYDHLVATVEFLVVNYKGGGKSVDSANINSNTANLRLATERLDGGHYDLDYYNSIVNDKDWVRYKGE